MGNDQLSLDLNKEEKNKNDEKKLKEKESLLKKISTANYDDVKSKVSNILNRFPDTRNSDKILIQKYWKTYYSELIYNNDLISLSSLIELENPASIIRSRQKIQNDYGLFRPSNDIQSRRKTKEQSEKQKQLSDKPDTPLITFFADESGKNDSYILVGGVCSADTQEIERFQKRISEWKKANRIYHEFHFAKLNKERLESYKEFFSYSYEQLGALSFKVIGIRVQSLLKGRTLSQTVYDLYYQLAYQGLEHEIENNRANLPRTVNIFKDKEDGSDGLYLSELKQDLENKLKIRYDRKMELGILEPVDSCENELIQLSDLFIGSVNRVLNGSISKLQK
jgi:Protein of unknown function (DUF3800)